MICVTPHDKASFRVKVRVLCKVIIPNAIAGFHISTAIATMNVEEQEVPLSFTICPVETHWLIKGTFNSCMVQC